MVCPLGSRRMEAIARLLEAGSFSQATAEEVGNRKLAAQFIHRELREADESNLLDEEDMHVFDLKPMTDPLFLVCCNTCKKPIKASQYAAHSELCKFLSSSEEIVSELDSGAGNKKPPRKERKKLLTANANTLGAEKERSESVDADNVATSEFPLTEQLQVTSAFSMEGKGNSSCVGGELVADYSGVSPGNTHYSTGAMPRPPKRSKFVAAQGLPVSDNSEAASGEAKSLCRITQEAHTCREIPIRSGGASGKNLDCGVGYKKPGEVHEYYLVNKDVPAPLATKIFYSQRNNRLRSELAYLYDKASSKEQTDDLVDPKALQGHSMPLQVSSPMSYSHEQINRKREKKQKQPLPSLQKADQVCADSSDVHGKVRGCIPAMSFSDRVPGNDVLISQTSPVGIMRNSYFAKPYSFAGNSGSQLGTIQQPKGSVPVT